jgi:outer membrane protein insertion porin family
VNVTLVNPDGVPVPVNPANARAGSVSIPIPVSQIVFTGGDTTLLSNLEYRIPIAGPVVLALFDDTGINAAARLSQLQLSTTQINALDNTQFGCPQYTAGVGCFPLSPSQVPTFSKDLMPISGTNWLPRMSTGAELQVMMPVINAPFRIYWAYNPLRLDKFVTTPSPITRSMFPAGAAGTYTFETTNALYAPEYLLREPRKTYRFTVSTTF